MFRYVYLYKISNIETLQRDMKLYFRNISKDEEIQSYTFQDSRSISRYNNTIYIENNNSCEIWIYPQCNCFVVLVEKIKDMRKLTFIKQYEEIQLANNQVVNKFFQVGISNNLTKLSIETIEEYGDENFDLMGNRLLNQEIVYDLGIFENDSIWRIKEFSCQILGAKYGITIKSPNRIRFNESVEQIEVREILHSILKVVGG